jgi:HK97 family phage major capsid protein
MTVTISANDVAERLAENARITGKIDELVADATTKALARIEERITDPKNGFMIKTADGNGEGVKTIADFLVTVRAASKGEGWAAKRLQDHYGAVKDLSGGSDGAGGYTIPPDFRRELLQPGADPALLVGPRATEIRTTARSIDFPTLDVDTAPANGSAAYGGVVMTLTGEGVGKTQTEPAFGTLNIPVYKLAAYTVASDELLADAAFGLEDLLKALFRGAVMDAWEYYWLNGSGSGQPLGILHSNATGTITVSRATGAADFELADALAMKTRLLVKTPAKVAWGMHPFLEADLVNMALNGNTCLSYVPNLNDAPPLRLLGYPVVFSEHMADPGDAGDVVLGDFSGYIKVVRQEVTIDTSIHYKFINDQTTWRVVTRAGGKPWLSSPVPMRGHAEGTGTGDVDFTRSHFVKLGA